MLFDHTDSVAEIGKLLHWILDDPTSSNGEKDEGLFSAEERITKLIDEGCDINDIDDQGHTVLSWLVICQNWNSNVESFVQRIVLEWDGDINHKDSRGYTPLIWAAMFDRPSVIRLLLSLGANPKLAQKEDKDAFYFAIECDNQAALHELNAQS